MWIEKSKCDPRKDSNPIVQIEGGFSMSLSSIIESRRERAGGLAGSFKRQFIISFLSHYVKTIAFCKRCSFGIIKKSLICRIWLHMWYFCTLQWSGEVLISKDTSSSKTFVYSNLNLSSVGLLCELSKSTNLLQKCHLQ